MRNLTTAWEVPGRGPRGGHHAPPAPPPPALLPLNHRQPLQQGPGGQPRHETLLTTPWSAPCMTPPLGALWCQGGCLGRGRDVAERFPPGAGNGWREIPKCLHPWSRTPTACQNGFPTHLCNAWGDVRAMETFVDLSDIFLNTTPWWSKSPKFYKMDHFMTLSSQRPISETGGHPYLKVMNHSGRFFGASCSDEGQNKLSKIAIIQQLMPRGGVDKDTKPGKE